MSPRPLLIACVATGLMLAAPAARAHAILVASQPGADATVPAGHVEIVLRYNSRIDAKRSRLTLTSPGGATAVLPIAAEPSPDVLTAASDLRPGAYSLRWQVLATDGHLTRGDLPFTLVAPKVVP